MLKPESCPQCGSANIKRTHASTPLSVSGDRLCSACGAEWVPPIPPWTGWVLGSFFVLTATGGAVMVIAVLDGSASHERNIVFELLAALLEVLVSGISVGFARKVIKGDYRKITIISPGDPELRRVDRDLI